MFVLCLGLCEFGLLSDGEEGTSWVIKSSSVLLEMGQSSHAGHELFQELIVGTHAVLFSPSASGEICSWKG